MALPQMLERHWTQPVREDDPLPAIPPIMIALIVLAAVEGAALRAATAAGGSSCRG